ncbi:hypothetical protein FIV06_15620 [Labrenzia sp. THAF191b]|nr:hypothetical protein FIV06_15620 [Labrenzia sp. THAF191b]QFT05170.1 hypothetical protein FIV05_15615 [Labrenzia sp. THAF191a]QFT16714.1 hypothetical protein FIV03_15630 [Labrenzia sp. THAF187b]
MEDGSIDVLRMAGAITSLERQIRQCGVAEVRMSQDVDQLAKAETECGKTSVGEHLRKSINTLPPGRVHWIGAFDENGKCVATCASRFDDISGWSLQRFMHEFWTRSFPGEDGQPAKLAPHACNFAARYTGSFAYIGEGAVRKSHRGRNLLGLVQRTLILSVWFLWRPSLIYGYMRPPMIDAGYDLNWGYTIRVRHAHDWENPPLQKDLLDLVFVAVGVEGIHRLVSQEQLADPFRLEKNSSLEKALPASSQEAQ